MSSCFYAMKIRNHNKWKTDPEKMIINNHYVSINASKIENLLGIVFHEREDLGLIGGLAYLSAYLMIPYGKEGRQYVAQKIHPAAMEDFLWNHAVAILNNVGIPDTEEHRKLYELMKDYCRYYPCDTVPFGPAGVAVTLNRFFAEETKSAKVTRRDFSTSEKDAQNYSAYADHRMNLIAALHDNPPAELAPDEFVCLMLSKRPCPIAFEMTDAHRLEIDNHPLFTGYTE